MTEQHPAAAKPAIETKPAPAVKPHTPATTSTTKPAPEKPVDFNSPEPEAEKTASPSAAEAAPASPGTTEKRRGRPPRDPNATPAPKAEAAPPKAVGEMSLADLLKEKEKSVTALVKAHETTGLHLPRLAEIAEAIKTKLGSL